MNNIGIRTRMISGPVGTSTDITSKSGFLDSLVNVLEAKKVSAMLGRGICITFQKIRDTIPTVETIPT